MKNKFMGHPITKNEYFYFDEYNKDFRSEDINGVKKDIYNLEKQEIKILLDEIFEDEYLNKNNTLHRLSDIIADLLETIENTLE